MAENEELNDRPRSGRPTELDDEDMISGLENEPSSSSRELAAELNVSQTQLTWRTDGRKWWKMMTCILK
ncbi:hypothetical protein KIN20_029742 [Parelaphostrongylus tenuis]|nr:hypothetical protein KIN20_015237 [Parelaphostrongylus tenuis]KAJ1360053.1 hypothetical protein KIN20_018933 [Parelaphostrongylus tenuis]KAJ1368584.1 hypothetical protein KIN20_029742 [Parelaphostrongylus tenuis]